ncbi:hypothetical protein [Oxalobacter formigenes]
MELSRKIHNSIYSRKALAITRDAYKNYCSVTVRPQKDGDVIVIVIPHEAFRNQARQVIFEFWNYFLDISCKQHLKTV